MFVKQGVRKTRNYVYDEERLRRPRLTLLRRGLVSSSGKTIRSFKSNKVDIHQILSKNKNLAFVLLDLQDTLTFYKNNFINPHFTETPDVKRKFTKFSLCPNISLSPLPPPFLFLLCHFIIVDNLDPYQI